MSLSWDWNWLILLPSCSGTWSFLSLSQRSTRISPEEISMLHLKGSLLRSRARYLHLCRNLSFLNAYHWLLNNFFLFFLCLYELCVLWYMLAILMISLKYQCYIAALWDCFLQQCLPPKADVAAFERGLAVSVSGCVSQKDVRCCAVRQVWGRWLCVQGWISGKMFQGGI